MLTNEHLVRYIDMIKSGKVRACEEQHLLVKMVERVFETEDVHTDDTQAERFLGLLKYFPYTLLPWEKFIFVLHNCTYNKDGTVRFPDLFTYLGRGSGKNGYLSFEDFALSTPVHGVKDYHISTFATAEENAKTSFNDIYNILQDNEIFFKNSFYWTKEVIRNLRTGSEITYHTSNPKTKDGGRPGKVNFDELHTYENYKLLDVALTGLGKKPNTRTTIITTDGDVRDGPLDNYKEKARAILKGEEPDNGFLPFMCCLKPDEINDPENWIMAVPSINDFPELKRTMVKEFADFKKDPITHQAFSTKRCNCPYGENEASLTNWDNIKACCSGTMPENLSVLDKKPCVFGVDFTEINDFASAGLLFLVNGVYYFIQHTWICKQSPKLHKVRFPYSQAIMRGEATLVDEVEIPAHMIAEWVDSMREKYNILMGAADNYRFGYLKRAFNCMGLEGEIRRNSNNWGKDLRKIYVNRPSDINKVAPVICSALENRRLYCGDSMIMRWYMGNVKKTVKNGFITFDKIEGQSRKTDGFMAFVAAMSNCEILEKYDSSTAKVIRPRVRTYN